MLFNENMAKIIVPIKTLSSLGKVLNTNFECGGIVGLEKRESFLYVKDYHLIKGQEGSVSLSDVALMV